ncbi:mechanosensitive ion channel family protein [Thalassovita mediterranea]|jgi:small conductance mechanosensitive channel|uniref:Small-conductance mechanosensitive channel n=1 Tax=Thalassovita mediterranea TaxID=340021 RepID=A0A0P1GRB4_9RHOB|nr:mechanosensitive ion channel domain-containing protein [Thalassovita mediterranea]MCG7572934.1 mechanosensitive ion channel [Phaeobacter sp. CNT1-3]CUH85201.1 Small-conductance mechanosensitive channel [Thalassovita mediterranea]SIS30754.1 small conductance mechanosensitive channel [Thalassovita mediterranea]
MTLADILKTEVWNGQSLASLLTLDALTGAALSVTGAVVMLLLGFVVGGWARRRITKLGLQYEALDDTLFIFLGNISRYVIIGFALLFVLNTFGIQTTSIVAVVGAAGLAIGLALQGTLSNVAAGVMIIVFRPIKLGDFVTVGGQSGTVKSISLNYTELASADNVQTIIPNANVWGNTITNFSIYETRRAEWIFGVAYDADLKKAEEVIRTTLMSDPRALQDPAPYLQVNNLGDFSVDFLARVWVKSSDNFAYQADMKRAVKEALDEAGIDIPFPTQTLLQSK